MAELLCSCRRPEASVGHVSQHSQGGSLHVVCGVSADIRPEKECLRSGGADSDFEWNRSFSPDIWVKHVYDIWKLFLKVLNWIECWILFIHSHLKQRGEKMIKKWKMITSVNSQQNPGSMQRVYRTQVSLFHPFCMLTSSLSSWNNRSISVSIHADVFPSCPPPSVHFSSSIFIFFGCERLLFPSL